MKKSLSDHKKGKEMKSRQIFLVILYLIGLTSIAACGSNADSETRGSAVTNESVPATVEVPPTVEVVSTRFGWSPSVGAAPIAVALAEGYWDGSAAEVKAQTFTTGREALEALLGGQLDIAMLAELPAVTAALNEADFLVVADFARYERYRVITTSDSGIQSLEDLDGRTVGTTLGTNMQYMLDQIAETKGITVKTVNAAPTDLVAVLDRGDIDAAVMFESFYPGAKKALGDRYVEIPFDGYTSHLLIVVAGDFAKKNPGTVQSFVDGLARASMLITDNPSAAQEAVANQLGQNTNLDVIRSVWDEYDFKLQLDDGLVDIMTAEGQWVVGKGVVDGKPSPALFKPYLDNSYVREAIGS